MEGLASKGSRVLNRETREDIGSYNDLREKLGEIQGEEKVFDTWMDSSNSNLFVSGYLNQPEVFDKAFPTSLRPQGKEIVRTWLYYTLLKSALLLDKPGFKHVWIDGLGMDHGAVRCPNLSAMVSMLIAFLNVEQVVEQVHGKFVDLRSQLASKQVKWKRMLPPLEGM